MFQRADEDFVEKGGNDVEVVESMKARNMFMRTEAQHREKIDKLNLTVAEQQDEIKKYRTQMRELFDANDEKIVSMAYSEPFKPYSQT